MSSAVWASTVAHFQAALGEDGVTVDTMKFVAACDEVANVYDALFPAVLARQLKGDILNSAGTVRNVFLASPDKCATLKDMVEMELKTKGRDKVRTDKATGIIGMLWAKRAVQFIMVLMELLGTRPDLTGAQCAQETYSRVLMKYHGWLTSKAVSVAMGLAPSRDDIFAKLGLKGPEAKEKIEGFVGVIRTLLDQVQALLDKYDLDFPDKV